MFRCQLNGQVLALHGGVQAKEIFPCHFFQELCQKHDSQHYGLVIYCVGYFPYLGSSRGNTVFREHEPTSTLLCICLQSSLPWPNVQTQAQGAWLASQDRFCQQCPSPYERLLNLRSRHRLKKHGQRLRMDSTDSILLLQKTAGLQQLSAKHASHDSAVPVVRVASVFYSVLKLSLEIIPPDLIIPPPFPLFTYSPNFSKLQRKQGFQ